MPFFVFGSCCCKLLKQKLCAVLVALGCALQEASSSPRPSGYVYCFDLSLEEIPEG